MVFELNIGPNWTRPKLLFSETNEEKIIFIIDLSVSVTETHYRTAKPTQLKSFVCIFTLLISLRVVVMFVNVTTRTTLEISVLSDILPSCRKAWLAFCITVL